MLKDTKSLGNNKAPACESRGFVLKKKKVRILTHLHFFSLFSKQALFLALFHDPSFNIPRLCTEVHTNLQHLSPVCFEW